MRVGSLFSGVGGFDLGFERAGMGLAWHSEIEPHACAVLRERWPDVPNLGDVTKIDGATIPPVDVICGGFPCQDLSVAGKRRGFEGERSVLAFEFLRIVREMREATDGAAPTFLVLENVPGLFTSAGGRDFGALLDALGDLRPMDVAWRVLDSRFFGVAQRRRRVFVVVDFGGERCDEILALTEGLRWNPPAGRAAREDVAGTLGSRSEKGGMRTTDLDWHGAYVPFLSPALKARDYKGPSSDGDGDGDGAPLIVAHTLRADGFDASEGEPTPAVAIRTAQTSANGHGIAEEAVHTLDRASGQAVVSSGVRRLTPRECERLQAFPDDWSRYGRKPDGSRYELADGPRYKCMGNAVTVSVAEWIGKQLAVAICGDRGGTDDDSQVDHPGVPQALEGRALPLVHGQGSGRCPPAQGEAGP